MRFLKLPKIDKNLCTNLIGGGEGGRGGWSKNRILGRTLSFDKLMLNLN